MIPQGVDNLDPAANEGYFIGVSNSVFGRLILRRVFTPATTPAVSANILIPVPATSFPMLVPHLGNSGGAGGQLSATDDRLYMAQMRNGQPVDIAQHRGEQHRHDQRHQDPRRRPLVRALRDRQPGRALAGPGGDGVHRLRRPTLNDQPYYFFPSVMISGRATR